MMLKKMFSLTLTSVLGFGVISNAAAADDVSDNQKIRLAIVTDLHYASTPAEEDMDVADSVSLSEKRMICEAERIFGQTMNDILETSPYSILISGDLTSNGEKKNAVELSEKLNEISKETDGGIYVMNGNHDINNSHAAEFINGTVQPAERMNTDEFKEIFRGFGYGENSRFFSGKAGEEVGSSGELSYAVEMCEGVTLIVLDGGCYSNNKNKQYSEAQKTEGEISGDLLEWAASESRAASENGNLVLAMCHYGILPHMDYKSSIVESFNSNFVVSNWQEVAETLADAGTAAVLTGHYHGNDISSYISKKGNRIYDIQTASIVNYPVSWRTIDISVTEKNGKKTYDLDIDTNFVHDIKGTELSYNGISYNDIQQYAFNKYGINNDTIKGLSEFFLRELLYNIRFFDDDTFGSGLQGYLRKVIGTESVSSGEAVSEKIKKFIADKLPVDTLFSLGDTGEVLGIMSDIGISMSEPVIEKNIFTADVTMKYLCNIDGQDAEVTESTKISIDFSVLSAAVENIIAELQKEMNKSEFTNYSSSDIKDDINKLLADVINSIAEIRLDGNVTLAGILNDAYSVQAMGNEETEVDEAVRQIFGEDITPEKMNRKRLEWNRQLTDKVFINDLISTALDSISSVKSDPDYNILSDIINTPFTEDGRSLITLTETSLTADVGGIEADTLGQMSLIDTFGSYFLSITDTAKLLDTVVFLQKNASLFPNEALSGFMSELSQLYLAMTENYSENEDHSFSFEYTSIVERSSPVRVAENQMISDENSRKSNKNESSNNDCPKTGDSSHVAVYLTMLTVSLAAALLSGRNKDKDDLSIKKE